MKKTVYIALGFLIAVSLVALSEVYAANNNQDSMGKLTDDVVEEVLDELLFDNIASLAGPVCDLNALLTVDFASWPGQQWSFVWSLLDITVLARNEPWRELIWALDDRRAELVEEMSVVKKKKCLLNASLLEVQNKQGDEAYDKRKRSVEKMTEELETIERKYNFLTERRNEMAYDKGPKFIDVNKAKVGEYNVSAVETGRIFYWLFTPSFFGANWDQIVEDSTEFAERTVEKDLAVFYENLPSGCTAGLTLTTDLIFAFFYPVGSIIDAYDKLVTGEDNQKIIDGIQKACGMKKDAPDIIIKDKANSLDKEYDDFMTNLEKIIEKVGKWLPEAEGEVLRLEIIKQTNGSLNTAEARRYESMKFWRDTFEGMLEYYTLVLSKVGSPASQSLSSLGDSLSNFVEAVLGVSKDEKGKASSRLALAERFQKRKKAQLQKICGRIEAVYREAGRSVSDLPVIGFADGETYCRAQQDCADVNVSNVGDGISGLSKLAKCSGFSFSGSEMGVSQATQDAIDIVGEDIGNIMEQETYNELLKTRNLHYESLRNRYGGMYGAQTDSTAVLELILKDVSKDLYPIKIDDPTKQDLQLPKTYDPDGQKAGTHYSILRKLYVDFFNFAKQQKGTCAAPEEVPEE